MYVDVHTHLTHAEFSEDWQQVIKSAEAEGLGAIVVNGMEPVSNRQILAMSQKYPLIKTAMGIYPIHAAYDRLTKPLPYTITPFDRAAEIDYIAASARAGDLAAVGECGLDLYWMEDSSLPQQESVWIRLLEIGKTYDLPVIIHSRKAEVRCAEILAHHGIQKVNMHCFGGKVAHAVQWAEKYQWHFSIPANARKNEAFQGMLKKLPLELILTETDAPYLGPVRGERNEPKNVVGTVALLAELRGMSVEDAKAQVWQNYKSLFGDKA